MLRTIRLVTIVFFLVSVSTTLWAQEDNIPDSVKVLDELVVKAYRANRPLTEVPAAIGLIDTRQFNRFSLGSMVSAINTIPGVRMEERSPGSYRFSMRGSLLRSPFGVRNVKFYYKGLPFTDGGGNTYLNILDQSMIGRMELIKGPGASLYGAGTGGVVLLDAPSLKPSTIDYSILAGSYGLLKGAGAANITLEKSSINLAASYMTSQGYRDQSGMKRTSVLLDWTRTLSNRSDISVFVLSSTLHYETPGGLNAAQFEADPRQSRPRAGTIPGAAEQRAAINNNTVYSGVMYQMFWNNNWSTTAGMYASNTDFNNPAILNYEQRMENNFGGRTETQYTFERTSLKGKATFGGEYQYFKSPVTVYDNNQGTIGNLRTDDMLWSKSFLAFAQIELDLKHNFSLSAGGSFNSLNYSYERRSVQPVVSQNRKFDPAVFPRVALIKKFNEFVSAYASVSQGFSAPSLAEVRPSTGNFNNSLKPELGTSYETGARGLLPGGIRYNVALYNFRLKETIVVQSRTSDGADYFQNAGNTSQYGVEATASWERNWGVTKPGSIRFWTSYTYNDYHFKNYVVNGNDYSGNRVTGITPVVFGAGGDVVIRRYYANVTMNYNDHIPVNDFSSEFAAKYTLLGVRTGVKVPAKAGYTFEFFIGADNLLDVKYSLGNDLNAAGGRYYNPAAGRNFYGGVRLFKL